MERLPQMSKTPISPSISTSPVSVVASSPSNTQQLRQITSNDKVITPFRYPNESYPPVSPYIHSLGTQDSYSITSSPSSPTSTNSTLPVIHQQRDQLLRGNFTQRDIIPSSITETIHHTSGDAVVKEVTPTNITTNGASVPELLNNSEVVSIAAQQQQTQPETNVDGDTSSALNVIPPKSGQTYVDITEYLNMPQSDAAKKLGVPTSTLSKRWKEAVRGRKWPYRMVCKLDKEIMTLLHNIPQGPGAPPLPEEVEATLGLLIRKRSEELKPVVIRI